MGFLVSKKRCGARLHGRQRTFKMLKAIDDYSDRDCGTCTERLDPR